MRQWILFYRKEMLEMSRNYKWMWIPLVFMLLGIMQPVMTYFLPEILKNAGNMPKGTLITIPVPTGGEVLGQMLGQYGMLGLLILVLSMMAIVSGERQSGVASLILVKPVSYISYITAKWAGMVSITAVSFMLGYAGGWYYTGQLIGSVDTAWALQAFGFYLLWLIFIVTVTLAVSSVLSNAAGVAFVTLGLAALLTALSGLFHKALLWSPSHLTDIAAGWLQSGDTDWPIVPIVIVTLILMACCLALSVTAVRIKETKA